ncbi:MAG: hypothetical protein SOZ27_00750 [Spirochaetia bacterium]|nr:hypothetical protein [Spirochaetia bacterium]
MKKTILLLMGLLVFWGCADTKNDFGQGKYILTDTNGNEIKFSIDDEKIVFDGGSEYLYGLVEGTEFVDADNWQLGIDFDGGTRQLVVQMKGDKMMGLYYIVVEGSTLQEHWLFASTPYKINEAVTLPVNIKSVKYRNKTVDAVDLN